MTRRPTAPLLAIACAVEACSLALDFDRAQLPPSPPRDAAAEAGADVARDVAGDVADVANDVDACGVGARYCPARGACAACCAHAECGSGERCCGGACCRASQCPQGCQP